ncbi:MAG: SCO family protein [Parvularculaceae bacterium]
MLKVLGKECGNSNWTARALAAPLLALVVFAAFAGCSRAPKVEVPADGVIRLSEQFSGDFALIDQQGKAVADEDFRGKVEIVYFGFASCPDVCPMALGALSAALNELTDKERAQVVPLFITVDPERDTPEILKAFLSFDDRIIGLTGAPEAAAAARQSFKVYARKVPQPESALGYTMDHSSLFYVVDRQGQPQLALNDSLTAPQLAEMVRRAIKS